MALERVMSLLIIRVTGRWEEPQVAGKKALFDVLRPSDSLRTEKSENFKLRAQARVFRELGVGLFWQTWTEENQNIATIIVRN